MVIAPDLLFISDNVVCPCTKTLHIIYTDVMSCSCAANGTPGPSSYSPTTAATTSRKAAYSLRARPSTPSRSSSGPGPGHYPCTSQKAHVGRAPNSPSYTFGLKTALSTEGDRKPGPAGKLHCRSRHSISLCAHAVNDRPAEVVVVYTASMALNSSLVNSCSGWNRTSHTYKNAALLRMASAACLACWLANNQF